MAKPKDRFSQLNPEESEIIECKRCGQRCKIAASPGEKARMLRFAKGPGLCVNCAVHDWLRNTYPVNMLLARSGSKGLLFPHIQEQFTEIMRVGFADAMPDEIDWQKIVDNWELPFTDEIKPSCVNPYSQKELDEIASGERPGLGEFSSKRQTVCGDDLTITSFEQLNELTPGLGDDLRKCLGKE